MKPEHVIPVDYSTQASLERKPDDLRGQHLQVLAIVQLDEEEFADVVLRPMTSREWIRELVADGRTVFQIQSPFGGRILVDTQGADYVRYGARIA